MTRILHLITGADGAGLPLSAAADLAALPGPGLHLVTTAWMIPAPDLLGHEDLRLRAGHATRLAVMAEILLRDYGGRSAPVLLLPSLEAASLTLGHDTMLSWTEVLGGLQSAFRQAGTDLHLQLWQVQVPGSVTPETVTDLAAALGEEGVVAEARGVVQPDTDSDLAQQLRAAALVNTLTTRIAAQATAAGLQLVSGAQLRAYAMRQMAQLTMAGLAPDAGSAAALDQLAASWLRGLTESRAPFESTASK